MLSINLHILSEDSMITDLIIYRDFLGEYKILYSPRFLICISKNYICSKAFSRIVISKVTYVSSWEFFRTFIKWY